LINKDQSNSHLMISTDSSTTQKRPRNDLFGKNSLSSSSSSSSFFNNKKSRKVESTFIKDGNESYEGYKLVFTKFEGSQWPVLTEIISPDEDFVMTKKKSDLDLIY